MTAQAIQALFTREIMLREAVKLSGASAAEKLILEGAMTETFNLRGKDNLYTTTIVFEGQMFIIIHQKPLSFIMPADYEKYGLIGRHGRIQVAKEGETHETTYRKI